MKYEEYIKLKSGSQRINYWDRFNAVGEVTDKYKKDIDKYSLNICKGCGTIEGKPHFLGCKRGK